MALGWRGFLSAWEDFRSEAEEYRELDKERVLVLAHVSGQGKASGMKLGQAWTRHAALFQIQSDKVTKLFVYFDRERALADLGLSE
jgi:hypothetical protein